MGYEPSHRGKYKQARRAVVASTCEGCGKAAIPGFAYCSDCHAAPCEFSREDERPATDDRWRKGGG